MVLHYCNDGNMRNYLNQSENYLNYELKIFGLSYIANGLLNIHIAEKFIKTYIQEIYYSLVAFQ